MTNAVTPLFRLLLHYYGLIEIKIVTLPRFRYKHNLIRVSHTFHPFQDSEFSLTWITATRPIVESRFGVSENKDRFKPKTL